jgi:hypothetical protein
MFKMIEELNDSRMTRGSDVCRICFLQHPQLVDVRFAGDSIRGQNFQRNETFLANDVSAFAQERSNLSSFASHTVEYFPNQNFSEDQVPTLKSIPQGDGMVTAFTIPMIQYGRRRRCPAKLSRMALGKEFCESSPHNDKLDEERAGKRRACRGRMSRRVFLSNSTQTRFDDSIKSSPWRAVVAAGRRPWFTLHKEAESEIT